MTKEVVTAAYVIIGDEILSGRTQDKNLNFLALSLGEIGISLKEVRVVIDGENEIIEAVNALRQKYDYVFTSGGLGPTHDDITTETITKIFDDKLIQNPRATELLMQYYGEVKINKARMKMSYLPSKARLIENDIMSVSGFQIENVFVFAGIPRIFQSLFRGVKNDIEGGKKIKSIEVTISLTEGIIAAEFEKMQIKYPQVTMGSYPKQGQTSLVFRSIDYNLLEKSCGEMIEVLNKLESDAIISVVKSD